MNEEPKQIKCYCGHTTMCDCSPIDEPKQETLEEYISEVTKNFGDEMSIKFTSGGIKLGAKWQAERMYSEEDLLSAFEAGMMFIGEDKRSFKEWFEQNKKK